MSKSLQNLQRESASLQQQVEEFKKKTSKYVNSIVKLNDGVKGLQKENDGLSQRNPE